MRAANDLSANESASGTGNTFKRVVWVRWGRVTRLIVFCVAGGEEDEIASMAATERLSTEWT